MTTEVLPTRIPFFLFFIYIFFIFSPLFSLLPDGCKILYKLRDAKTQTKLNKHRENTTHEPTLLQIKNNLDYNNNFFC